MSQTNLSPALIIAIVVALLAIAAALWMYMRQKRSLELRSKFGPEYDKAIDEHRDRANAEAELEKRAKRVAQFDIHPLKAEERTKYAEEWHREQSLFVDDPRAAVNHADTLVQGVMRHRGYPVSDFEQNAANLSVDHPAVVQHFRAAHEIALRDNEGRANTEDLRNAMVNYRMLFDELLGKPIESRQIIEPRQEVRQRQEIRR